MSGTGEIETPFLKLIKPPVGADDDVWGDRINTNSDTLDASASGHDARIAALEAAVAALQAQTHPQEAVGSVKWWPTNTGFPPGFVLSDGTWYATATYPLLFAVLQYSWGGNGAGAFAVPDLRGMTLVMMDMGTGRLAGQYGPDRVGGTGGVALVALSGAQMPPHAHGGSTDAQGQHAHGFTALQYQGGPGAGQFSPGYAAAVSGTDAQGNHAHNIATDVQGGGAAHTNCQPGALGYWIIKAVNL